MQNIHISARFFLNEGTEPEALEKIASQLIALVREREPDCLQYLWFRDEQPSCYVVREIYKNSDAVLAHVANCGALLGQAIALGKLEVQIYGPVSDELRAAAAGFNATICSFFDGVDRVGG